ncbi:hypothetical protein Q5H92_13130 [Hymenobacter sp. M29]|uniref:Uncharacterized protein n=1 Tax=Hymenobacter mellowenesis TaxID=3063995 RepID=A0ABT9AD76_9BACT|nr:hypothetical protein [Hymenobacter sp. M29]MDO7847309.1 hypothetical protein [Hymenobacter sp. M29]
MLLFMMSVDWLGLLLLFALLTGILAAAFVLFRYLFRLVKGKKK